MKGKHYKKLMKCRDDLKALTERIEGRLDIPKDELFEERQAVISKSFESFNEADQKLKFRKMLYYLNQIVSNLGAILNDAGWEGFGGCWVGYGWSKGYLIKALQVNIRILQDKLDLLYERRLNLKRKERER